MQKTKRNPAPEPDPITPTAAPQPKPEPAELPQWMDKTPEVSYSLTMFGPDDDGIQNIELNRDEFIELKRHLAVMRGYAQKAA